MASVPAVAAKRIQGKVKWFNAPKGYGFIEVKGRKDVFVHFSAIKADGYKALKENDVVEFSIVQGEKGEQAADLEVVV